MGLSIYLGRPSSLPDSRLSMNQGVLICVIALAKLVLIRDAFAQFSSNGRPLVAEPIINTVAV